MLRHFLLTYFRNTGANKRTTIVNFLGLSMAISVILLISMYVKSEFTFDNFHKKSDRIFRLTTTLTTPGGEYKVAFANTAFAYKLLNNLPEVEDVACISESNSFLLKYENQALRESNIRFSTPGIFRLFNYSVIMGDPEKMLSEPNTVVLTKTLSDKLFGKKDPIGEVVQFNDMTFIVTGVIGDLPGNTDLKFNALLSTTVNGSEDITAWNDYYSFILVNENHAEEIQEKIEMIAESVYKPIFERENQNLSRTYKMQPLTKIHFDTSYLADTPKGNKTTVYIFLCISFLILVLAYINYVNLNLAQALKRYREFRIRKILGLGRNGMMLQIFGESVLTAFLSFIMALVIVVYILPVFNRLADTDFDAGFLIDLPLMAIMVAVIFLLGVISGIYPVTNLFRIVNSHGSNMNNLKNGIGRITRGLVAFQFVISISMICVIIGVNKQINHMQSSDLGFDNDHILAINLNSTNGASTNILPFKQELSTSFMVGSGGSGTNLGSSEEWMKPLYEVINENGQEVKFILNMPEVDDNYLKLFNIQLIEGRNFSKDHSDHNGSIIINEAYARIMDWKEPLDKKMSENSDSRVIGVVKDFHFESLHNQIEPLAFRFNESNPAYLFVKASPDQLDYIRSVWRKYFKDVPFEYEYVDDILNRQYDKDEKQKRIFGYLSFFAMIISCLGLYGLSSVFITRRIKEIGIRKINGARTSEILKMINSDFLLLVTIAFFVACPVAWIAMHKWLENFAYKTDLSWWIFVFAGILALGISLLTVSLQSWNTATRNPVEALRYE